MKRFTIAVALLATLSFVGSAQAGSASAVIDGITGQVTVSVTDVSNWFINSPAGSFSGPANATDTLPLAGASFVTDNDNTVGETSLGLFSYNADLGLVAVAAANDFTIHWTGALGTPEESGPINYVPEPTTLALAGLGLCGVLATRRRRVA